MAFVTRSSSTTLWPDCGGRWAANHARALVEEHGFELGRTPYTIMAMMGSSVHAGAAYDLKYKLEHEQSPSLTDAEDAALADLDQRLEESREADHEVNWDHTAAHRGDAQKQIRRMLRVVHEQVVPKISPIAVEEKLEVDLGDDFVVSGTLDYFCLASEGQIPLDISGTGIVDLKTGQEGLHVKQQGTYSLIRRSHGFSVDWLAIAHVPRVSLKQIQPDANWFLVPLGYAEQAARRTLFDIKERVQEFRRTGDPHVFPRNPFSKLCSKKWCPAHPDHQTAQPFCLDPITVRA